MTQPRQGRPPQPLDPDASHAARLGAEIRTRRQDRGLTLKALAALIGFSLQHLSEVELAKAPVSGAFVAACDRALDARGTLSALLPAVVCERALQRHDRSNARHRSASEVPVDAERQALVRALEPPRYAGPQHPSEAEEGVDPLSRRSLVGAGVEAALGLGATTPAAACDIDPELVSHWTQLMSLLDRHSATFGPREVLATVRRELDLISRHRQIARGALHTDLLRVEARWTAFASWLGRDAGDTRIARHCADRALQLAQEAGYADMTAYVLVRQSQWAVAELDARRAITFAEAARRTHGTSDQIRALCALKGSHAHALAGDAASCQRGLADAYAVFDRADTAEPPDVASHQVTPPYVAAAEARCWLWLQPSKAIAVYEDALRLWPHERTGKRGVHQARLALACAAIGEPQRAAAEGIKALDIARTTRSDLTARELKRLDQELAASDTRAAADFREAFAAL